MREHYSNTANSGNTGEVVREHYSHITVRNLNARTLLRSTVQARFGMEIPRRRQGKHFSHSKKINIVRTYQGIDTLSE
jgi:hypothetical protein